jgi:hypothetical protein
MRQYPAVVKVTARNIRNGKMFGLRLPESIMLNFRRVMKVSFAEWMMGFPPGWTING